MLNSRLGRFSAAVASFGAEPTPATASLLPKLRDQYAEFLDHVSLAHLRLLASPTCVGLRYGRRQASAGRFSRLPTPQRSGCPEGRPSHSGLGGFPPTPLDGRSTWPPLLRSSVTSGFIGRAAGPESSPARHRLRLWGLALGPASPCADRHGAGTLGLPVVGVFTPLRAYSFRHPHFPALHPFRSEDLGSRRGFHALGTLPYPSTSVEGHASAGRLIPTILGARTLDW